MPEVPEHLLPIDGVANIGVRFLEMHAVQHGCDVTLEFYRPATSDRPEKQMWTMTFFAGTHSNKPMNQMLVDAHSQANDVLRQALYMNEALRAHYEKEVARYCQAANTQ